MILKTVQPLTKETFAPFGQLIECPEELRAPSADFGWSVVAAPAFHGEVEVGWLKLVHKPMEVYTMEHHLGTPELIIPLDTPMVFPVAPADPSGEALPPADRVEAFLAQPGQALLLDQGAWHWLPFPSAETGSCLVVFRKDTPANDLFIRDLPGGEMVKFEV